MTGRIGNKSTAKKLLSASSRLSVSCSGLYFGPPVTHVYNPLEYAATARKQFMEKYAGTCRILFVGMNPGPWGMAQTGIPFGEIAAVREYLGIAAPVGRPSAEHPKRPIQGLDCPRSEVSGRRLWGLFRDRFPDPADFFRDHWVTNYCPLVFMEESGRNRTPDKLPGAEREPLYSLCDDHLREVVSILGPEWVIGVGNFASGRIAASLPGQRSGTILHPSPANPRANKGWAEAAAGQLKALGIPGWT